MIHLNKIPLDYEPRRKILPKLQDCPTGFRNPEMSEFDSAFLCGAIKQFHPKKILEVGVASGASTSIILQALEDIGEPYKIYSVDASSGWYRDKTKPSGFMATFALDNNLFAPQSTLRGEHKFYLGKYLPQVIDEIGGDIDFVILDTVHYTPGELLDFPVMLPYLKDGAIVVLHDVSFNHDADPLAYATTALLSAVTSEKKFINLVEYEPTKSRCYPNIAAFSVGKRTQDHIENLFLSLVITWRYVPDDKQLEIYREFYKKHYPAELVGIFDETIKMNRKIASADILIYQTYVAKKGWGKWISENRISDDIAQNLRIEAVKISFPAHDVYYSVCYNDKEGWSKEVASPEQAGTTGNGKPIYGIKIRLDEADAKKFDILYRVHKFDGEWTAWAKNGEAIYSHGQKLNAIQIKMEPK